MRKRHWSYQGEKNRNAIVAMRLPCAIQGPKCLGLGTTADHILPGGPDIMENLQPACVNCQNWKGDRLERAGPVWTGDRAQDVLRADSDAQRRGPFFSDRGYQYRPLLNTPPRTRWTPLGTADYRQAPTRDDRSR